MPLTTPVRRPANALRRMVTPLDQEVAPFATADRSAITDNPNVEWARQLHGRFGGEWVGQGPIGLWPDERSFDLMRQTSPIGAAEQRRAVSLLGQGWTLRKGSGDGSEELFSFWSSALAELDMAAILRDALRMVLEGWQVFECVGDVRQWERRDVFVPIMISEVDSWDFRYTQGRDLVDLRGRTSGNGTWERWLTSTNPVAQAKWWRPSFSDSRQGYGRSVGKLLAPSYMQLVNSMVQGFAAALRAQGFLKVERRGAGDVEKQSRSQLRDDYIAVGSSIFTALADFSATGVLQVPKGYEISWESLGSAVEGWISLWNHLGNAAKELLQGATLTTALTGPNGSRALGETHRAGEKDLVSCDAHLLAGQLNRLFRPWSLLNADAIFRFPRDRFGRPMISADALPKVEFAAVDVATPEEQKAAADRMRLAKELRITGPEARVSFDTWMRTGRVSLLPDDADDVTAFEFAEAEVPPPGPGLLHNPGPLGERIGRQPAQPEEEMPSGASQ